MNLTKQDAKFMPMTISVKTNQYNGVASLRDLDLNNIKLAVFTYPNYYGETFDIEESINELLALKKVTYPIDTIFKEFKPLTSLLINMNGGLWVEK